MGSLPFESGVNSKSWLCQPKPKPRLRKVSPSLARVSPSSTHLASVLDAVFLGDGRAVEELHAERFRDLQRRVGVLELGEAEMAGRHGEPVLLEARREAFGLGIEAAEAFDLPVAKLGDAGEDAIERREIAGAVELEGKVHEKPASRVRPQPAPAFCTEAGRCDRR